MKRIGASLLVEEGARVTIAAAIAGSADDVGGDVSSGAPRTEAVASMAGSDESQ